MSTLAAGWNSVRKDVQARFAELAPKGDAAARALEALDTWLAGTMFAAQQEAILAHTAAGQEALLLDSFYQLVPFGTGGRRGRVGFGPNRINPITVAMSVQGHCDFLRQTGGAEGAAKIVVAFDTRYFGDMAGTYSFLGDKNPLVGVTSRSLARIAAEIYAGNGFQVYLAGLNSDAEYLSTPELSFAINHLGAVGGMNVSASHNPPDDNGFKFFNAQGAQDIAPTDQEMTSYMGDVSEIRTTAFGDAVAAGSVLPLPAGLHKAYLDVNLGLSAAEHPPLTVVYTPLCGVGNGSVGDVLRAAGFDVRLYAEHAGHDGTFKSIPFRLPNPEVPEAASPALKWADELKCDLVLSTDPDADRLGVFARDSAGRWRYLNGNEIASILAYYLVADEARGPKRTGLLIKTLVTTRALTQIAQSADCPIVGDLLVGFKFIAHVLDSLEREGRYEGIEISPDKLVIAGEESHGVLLTAKIRDKDAAGGALVLCDLVARLQAEGKHLPEYLDALSMKNGNYQNIARSVVLRGIRGAGLLADMMRSLREDPPKEFDGSPVLRSRDLLSTEHGPVRTDTERLSRNFLVFETEKAQIVVRPSGTEPKAKIYVDFCGEGLPDRQAAAQAAKGLSTQVFEECIRRIGFGLSECAHLLPDYVDIDLKADFDNTFRRDLSGALDELGKRDAEGRLAWLRERLRAYGGGADPLGPTASALDALFVEMRPAAGPGAAVLDDLRKAVAAARTPVAWVT